MEPRPGLEGAADAAAAEDQCPGREVRAGDDLHQLVERRIRRLDQLQRGVDDLGRIVRRDIGRHADGDAVGAVHQQVREGCRQHARLIRALVVIGLEVDRILVDAFQQGGRRLGQPGLGVTHGGRGVAIHRAEIALAVDQRDAEREALRHADHGIVNRAVAMRVILTHDVADHAGGFLVRLVGREAVLVHREQDAAMHRLQAVPRIRQRAGDDDAHRISEVGAAHLLLDRDGHHAFWQRVAVVGQVAAVVAVAHAVILFSGAGPEVCRTCRARPESTHLILCWAPAAKSAGRTGQCRWKCQAPDAPGPSHRPRS
jgi:hypothetical protein